MVVVPRLDDTHDWRSGLEAGPDYTPAIIPTVWGTLHIVVAILVQILLAVCLSQYSSAEAEYTESSLTRIIARVFATLSSLRKIPVALWRKSTQGHRPL